MGRTLLTPIPYVSIFWQVDIICVSFLTYPGFPFPGFTFPMFPVWFVCCSASHDFEWTWDSCRVWEHCWIEIVSLRAGNGAGNWFLFGCLSRFSASLSYPFPVSLFLCSMFGIVFIDRLAIVKTRFIVSGYESTLKRDSVTKGRFRACK